MAEYENLCECCDQLFYSKKQHTRTCENNMQGPNNCQAGFVANSVIGTNSYIFTNTSLPILGLPGTVLEFDLDYGDGTVDYNVSNPVTHNYVNQGMYNACLTMWVVDTIMGQNCTSIYCDSIVVGGGGPSFIDNVSNGKIVLYPNPTTDIVFVSMVGYKGAYYIELYDLYGRWLETINSNYISLKSYAKGVYLFKVHYGNAFEELRVINN